MTVIATGFYTKDQSVKEKLNQDQYIADDKGIFVYSPKHFTNSTPLTQQSNHMNLRKDM